MRPIHVSVIAGLSLASLGMTQAGILDGIVEGELEGAVYAGLNTEYIWRGVDQGGGSMVEAGVEWGGLSFWGFDYHSSLWYASVHNGGGARYQVIDPGGPNETIVARDRGSFDEIDYSSGISRDLGFMTLEIGQILYNFPGGGTDFSSAQEVYFGARRTQWNTDFAFTYFWDIDEDNQGYSELTADHSFVLSECLSLATGGTLSYNWEGGELHHIGLTAALNWAYNDVLTVSPYVSVTIAQDGAEKAGRSYYTDPGDPNVLLWSDQGDEIFGGIVVKASF